ncbi:MAG: PQQ-dependent sugar dehydrogenase [Gemmatimonadetes bacterium]|nr:PQQ-dependent sugar dehydrogenase [Gemmatimonadota bacterium]MBT8404050.1 PQQ-dependent sugar dehydrogenase [Gemmatimonadota bacterium]NNK63915.1 PQQ-dependent sugar dehydrogenase [Gemmatimonadota bacterium]
MPTRSLFNGTLALAVFAILGGCAETTPATASDQEAGFRVTTVVEGLEHPWGMAFLPGGDMLVTERPGRLRVVRNGALVEAPVSGVPEVWSRGQGGLLDVALHPDFESTGWVYLSYSKPGPGGTATTAVVRGRFDGSALSDVEEIFEADAFTENGVHFGSRLAFDGEDHLFVSIGDRGERDQAQNPLNHQGTIVRLHDDGRVPADNPFVGRADVRPEIWATGIRSPQGLAFRPGTDQLWETEHGPRGGDELNIIRPEVNYGWPTITYGINYNGTPVGDGISEAPGLEQPVHYWVPSIATSGLAFYEGDAFPEWRGSAFVGGLAAVHLARLTLEGDAVVSGEELLADRGQRIRDVRVGPDGLIYVLVDSGRAPLWRLEPGTTAGGA